MGGGCVQSFGASSVKISGPFLKSLTIPIIFLHRSAADEISSRLREAESLAQRRHEALTKAETQWKKLTKIYKEQNAEFTQLKKVNLTLKNGLSSFSQSVVVADQSLAVASNNKSIATSNTSSEEELKSLREEVVALETELNEVKNNQKPKLPPQQQPTLSTPPPHRRHFSPSPRRRQITPSPRQPRRLLPASSAALSPLRRVSHL